MYTNNNFISAFLGLFFMAIIVFLFFYATILILPFVIFFVVVGAIIRFFSNKEEVKFQETTHTKITPKENSIIDAEFEVIDDK